MMGRTKDHPNDSLEKVVENLVKTWEMEAVHKEDQQQWQTMDVENYRMTCNGSQWFNASDLQTIGSYNILLNTCSKHLFDTEKETSESTMKLFKNIFSEGFPWEVLEVITGPPYCVFTWRHWGIKSGAFNDTPATGETIELSGMCAAKVTEDLKIQEIQLHFDPSSFLHKMLGSDGKTIAEINHNEVNAPNGGSCFGRLFK